MGGRALLVKDVVVSCHMNIIPNGVGNNVSSIATPLDKNGESDFYQDHTCASSTHNHEPTQNLVIRPEPFNFALGQLIQYANWPLLSSLEKIGLPWNRRRRTPE